jgi:hypothetical protein
MMRRCVECDELYDGVRDEHCKLEKHVLNTNVNYVLRIMNGMNLTVKELVAVVKKRKKGSNHGRLVL